MYIYHIARSKLESSAPFMPCSSHGSGYYTMNKLLSCEKHVYDKGIAHQINLAF